MIIADMNKLESSIPESTSTVGYVSSCNCGFCRICAIVNQQIELDLSDFYS